MITVPFIALKLMFSRPKVLALAFFPGAFTFVAATLITYGVWQQWLSTSSLYLSLPAMMVAFLLSWLVVGKLSLLPVEDLLIDECQRGLWGRVLIPGLPFSPARLTREIGYSLLVGVAGVLIVILSFIPFLTPVSIPVAGWLSAYGFLAPLYERKQAGSLEGRYALFMEHAASNLVLGLVLNLLLFVPVVNVFLLGYAQILATLLFLRRENPLDSGTP